MVKVKPPSAAKKKPLNMKTKSKTCTNPLRDPKKIKIKGGHVRDKATINRLNMYKGGKPIRNKHGKIIGGAFMMKNRVGNAPITTQTGRIKPDVRWFGNTRIISQNDLDKFRQEMSTRSADPFQFVMHRKKLPMSLLQEPTKVRSMNLLTTESFEDVFGKKKIRKRPKLESLDLGSMISRATEKTEKYGSGSNDTNIKFELDYKVEKSGKIFEKGQSRRIWSELYKVLDSSDVVIQVLDARNIPGTRCEHMEQYLSKNAAHKHLIFVVNKIDLVPTWVTKKWVRLLSERTPTLAFHASISNSFGKGALINLLRQFSKLHSDKKQISVGIVGYPNVGKSSIINTIRTKKVCKVAPIPGETKVWQYVTLMKRIYVIDSPGIVYNVGDSEADIVLKGVVRAERLPDPTDFVEPILNQAKAEHLKNLYDIPDWVSVEDFMEKLARRIGRLLPGGEPDHNCCAIHLINDWQRGKIPHFVPPPLAPGETPQSVADIPDPQFIVGNEGKVVMGEDAKSEGTAPATDMTPSAPASISSPRSADSVPKE